MRAHMVNEGMHDVYVRVQPQTASVVWVLVCVCVCVCEGRTYCDRIHAPAFAMWSLISGIS
jgi:hypothetical protein